jgi:NADPH oxidase
MVPPTSCVRHAYVHNYSCFIPLREVSDLFLHCRQALTNRCSFFNVERSQVRPEAAVQIHYNQAGGITGHVMLLCMLFMYTTAHAQIRKQSFETFWYTHHLFIPFLLAMYTHATGCFVRDSVPPYSPFAGAPFWNHCLGYEGWRWELVAGALYLFERIYREIKARRPTEIMRVIRHPFGMEWQPLYSYPDWLTYSRNDRNTTP